MKPKRKSGLLAPPLARQHARRSRYQQKEESARKYAQGVQRLAPPSPGRHTADNTRAEQIESNAQSGRMIGEKVSETAANALLPGLGAVVKPVNAITDKLTKKEDGTYKSQFAETASFASPFTIVNRLSEGLATGNGGDILDAFTFGLGSKVFNLETSSEKAAAEKRRQQALADRKNSEDAYRGADITRRQAVQYAKGTKGIACLANEKTKGKKMALKTKGRSA